MIHNEIIRNQLDSLRWNLITMHNAEATGIGNKTVKNQSTPELSIIFSVNKKMPLHKLSRRRRIPKTIRGIPTDVIETGQIRAFGFPRQREIISSDFKKSTLIETKSVNSFRSRPSCGGLSLAHIDVSAGTMGCLVKCLDEIFILSNNHILANSNFADPGDPILQPSIADGGMFSQDRLALLTSFIPLKFVEDRGLFALCNSATSLFRSIKSATLLSEIKKRRLEKEPPINIVDCAIAKPVNFDDVSTKILEIGNINGHIKAEAGMSIKKSGRTTGLTYGTIIQTDVAAWIHYGNNRHTWFTKQIMAGNMSHDGDSGSIVVNCNDNRAVGLLFAGNDNITLMNPIDEVMNALHIELIK